MSEGSPAHGASVWDNLGVDRPERYSLAIELTSRCNQHCSYCYNDWREDNGKEVGALPGDTLVELIQRALTEVKFDHVTLTGGEPFVRKDAFRILDACRDAGTKIQMISNGDLIDEEKAERLAQYPILAIQVTLNGPEAKLHNEHVGGEHFDQTIRGIKAMRKHGVPVAGCIVITRKNADRVAEILELFRSLDVELVALSRFSPSGFAAQSVAELLPSRSDMIRALELAEPFGEQGMNLQVTMPVPPCVVDHDDYPHVRFGSCPIGTEMQEFSLGPRGELRSCTLHTEVIGDATTTSFADLVEAPAVAAYRDVMPEFCEPCPHKKGCLGGCGAAAASVLGNPRGLDPFVAQHVDEAFAAKLAADRRVHLPVA